LLLAVESYRVEVHPLGWIPLDTGFSVSARMAFLILYLHSPILSTCPSSLSRRTLMIDITSKLGYRHSAVWFTKSKSAETCIDRSTWLILKFYRLKFYSTNRTPAQFSAAVSISIVFVQKQFQKPRERWVTYRCSFIKLVNADLWWTPTQGGHQTRK